MDLVREEPFPGADASGKLEALVGSGELVILGETGELGADDSGERVLTT